MASACGRGPGGPQGLTWAQLAALRDEDDEEAPADTMPHRDGLRDGDDADDEEAPAETLADGQGPDYHYAEKGSESGLSQDIAVVDAYEEDLPPLVGEEQGGARARQRLRPRASGTLPVARARESLQEGGEAPPLVFT